MLRNTTSAKSPSKGILGFFEDDIAWTLANDTKASKEAQAKPSITCPQCNRVYRGGACSVCGYEPTAKERKAEGLVWDGRELAEIQRTQPKENTRKQTNEEIMIRALYMAGRSGRTWKQAIGIAYGLANKQTTVFRVPKRFTVGGRTYNAVPFGSADSSRMVSDLYEFTNFEKVS